MQVPQDSIRRSGEVALPAWVIFPKYVPNAPVELKVRGKAASYMQLAENSFNQSAQGRKGFEALSDLIDRCDCYDFSYSRLDDAIAAFSSLPFSP
jgi:hypothetical protein